MIFSVGPERTRTVSFRLLFCALIQFSISYLFVYDLFFSLLLCSHLNVLFRHKMNMLCEEAAPHLTSKHQRRDAKRNYYLYEVRFVSIKSLHGNPRLMLLTHISSSTAIYGESFSPFSFLFGHRQRDGKRMGKYS